jgi:cytochrome c peroxidase
MKTRASVLLSATAGLLASVALYADPADPALVAQAQALFKPVPYGVAVLKSNTVTPPRSDLGKMLFFDPRLSKSGTISCNTCHNLGMGGDDNLPTSVGHGWQKGPRNSPTVLNAVFNVAQFWDGRAEDLKAQAKGPIQAGVEMANRPDAVVATLKSMPEYVQRFREAFPDDKDPVTFDNVAMAIESFEATLVTPDSRFDRLLKGETGALNAKELRGLQLFIGKGCVACHSGVNLGGQSYFPFGVVAAPDAKVRPPGDRGRFAVTKTETDSYVFRAAPLRNIALTAPYFHSGQVWDLKEAVAIMGSSQLGATLTEKETDEITAFLHTLTGKAPIVQVPELPVETAATPRPQL